MVSNTISLVWRRMNSGLPRRGRMKQPDGASHRGSRVFDADYRLAGKGYTRRREQATGLRSHRLPRVPFGFEEGYFRRARGIERGGSREWPGEVPFRFSAQPAGQFINGLGGHHGTAIQGCFILRRAPTAPATERSSRAKGESEGSIAPPVLRTLHHRLQPPGRSASRRCIPGSGSLRSPTCRAPFFR